MNHVLHVAGLRWGQQNAVLRPEIHFTLGFPRFLATQLKPFCTDKDLAFFLHAKSK